MTQPLEQLPLSVVPPLIVLAPRLRAQTDAQLLAESRRPGLAAMMKLYDIEDGTGTLALGQNHTSQTALLADKSMERVVDRLPNAQRADNVSGHDVRTGANAINQSLASNVGCSAVGPIHGRRSVRGMHAGSPSGSRRISLQSVGRHAAPPQQRQKAVSH